MSEATIPIKELMEKDRAIGYSVRVTRKVLLGFIELHGTDFFRIQPLPLIAVKLQSSFCFNTSESMSTL